MNPSPIPAAPCAGPRWNALKHGLRSSSILLPGEDAEAFEDIRQDLYEAHRPRTRLEARCVEAMAGHEWCMERCRRWRDHYHGLLKALISGDPTMAPHCEADPHRWHHKALDCTLEESRLGRLQERECRKLKALQELRRQNLLREAEGEAIALPPAAENSRDVQDERAEGSAHAATGHATSSRQDDFRKIRERPDGLKGDWRQHQAQPPQAGALSPSQSRTILRSPPAPEPETRN